MTAETRMLLMVILPLAASAFTLLFGRRPNLREASQLVIGTILFAIACSLAGTVFDGARPRVEIAQFTPGFSMTLQLEPLGMLFALVASGLWVLTTAYAMGYMRAHHEANQTRFFACFGIAIFAAMGAALAENLLTLFVFYEVMTLSTYPLVTHYGNEAARAGGRTYLSVLIFTSIAFLLFAIGWTWHLTGTLAFRDGGILREAWQTNRISTSGLGVLLALFAFGTGKAALMPFHRWLPAAMVAPTPVSALLHAVAVVKVGVFTILKVIIYVFGAELLQITEISTWLAYVAAFSILIASLVAMTKDNLKARLAYSTVSQLSYITLGAALATPASLVGASMHIAMHAVGKITLFFCAGAIYVATHKTEVSQMRGLGRRMPFTMGAFLLGSFSIIGLPPFGGAWSKWLLSSGAAAADQPLLVAVLMVSSLLNIAYLLPVAIAGFYRDPTPEGDDANHAPAEDQSQVHPIPHDGHQQPSVRFREAPLLCVVPPCLTAIGGVFLFFLADKLFHVLAPLGGGAN
jgi:multicomponent Na+:H+ antiporter subunit D